MNRKRLLLFALLLLFSGACDSIGGDPDISGTWSGVVTQHGFSFGLRLNLVESGDQVSGNGTLGVVSFTVTGVYRYPDLSITMISSGLLDNSYTGTVASDGQTITGTFIDPGAQAEVVLRR